MKNAKSSQLFAQAKEVFCGGVNSPVRAFKSVGCQPVFIERGEGAYIYDIDGNRYLDCIGAWGPAILGHANPAVIQAVRETAALGLGFGACHPLELELAGLVREYFSCAEKIRFVTSGTEACMSAIRLARGYTGRPKVIKFNGNYHGHADSFLVEAGSGVATLGIAGSQGVLGNAIADTLSVPYNDLALLEQAFRQHPGEIAAVIIEPVVGNAGCLLPAGGYLQGIRDLCTEHGSLLIFDEVMTGFRVARGGACQLFGVQPDLITLGKIIGGGLPVGAYAGRADIMQHVAPSGGVYQAGTLAGNPVCMAAGIATLRQLADEKRYQQLQETTDWFIGQLQDLFQKHSQPAFIQGIGSMLTVFFNDGSPVASYEDAKKCDTTRYAAFFQHMLSHGVYLPPSQFEAMFLGFQHDRAVLEQFLQATDSYLLTL